MTEADRIAEAGKLTADAVLLIEEDADPRVALPLLYQALAKLNPENSPLRSTAAQRQRGLTLAAKAHCLTCEARRIDFRERRLAVGRLHEALADINEALRFAGRNSELKRDLLIQRGQVHCELWDARSAHADFSQALRLAPAGRAAADIVEGCRRYGDCTLAIKACNQTLASVTEPEQLAAMLRVRSWCHLRQSRVGKALADAEAAQKFLEDCASAEDVHGHVFLLCDIATHATGLGQTQLADRVLVHCIDMCHTHVVDDIFASQLTVALTMLAHNKCAMNDHEGGALLYEAARRLARAVGDKNQLLEIKKSRRNHLRRSEEALEGPPPDFIQTLAERMKRLRDDQWRESDPAPDILQWVTAAQTVLTQPDEFDLDDSDRSTVARILEQFIADAGINPVEATADEAKNLRYLGTLMVRIRSFYDERSEFLKALAVTEARLALQISAEKGRDLWDSLWLEYLKLQLDRSEAGSLTRCCHEAASRYFETGYRSQKALRGQQIYFLRRLAACGHLDRAWLLASALMGALEILDPELTQLWLHAKIRLGFAHFFAGHSRLEWTRTVLNAVHAKRRLLDRHQQANWLVSRCYCLCEDETAHDSLVNDLVSAMRWSSKQRIHARKSDPYWVHSRRMHFGKAGASFAAIERDAIDAYVRHTRNRQDVAATLSRWGSMLRATGRLVQATACYERLVGIYQDADNLNDAESRQVSETCGTLALVAEMRGDNEGVRRNLEQAHNFARSDEDQQTWVLSTETSILYNRGLLSRALEVSDRALKLVPQVSGDQQSVICCQRAKILYQLGQEESAMQLLHQAVECAESNDKRNRARHERVNLLLRGLRNDRVQDFESLSTARSDLDHILSLRDQDHYALHKYYRVLRGQGKLRDALRVLRHAAILMQRNPVHEYTQYGYIYSGIALLLLELGKPEEAIECCRQFMLRESRLPPKDSAGLTISLVLARSQQELGRNVEAVQSYLDWHTRAAAFMSLLRESELRRSLEEEIWQGVLQSTEGLIQLCRDRPVQLREVLSHYECMLDLLTGSPPNIEDPKLEEARAERDARLESIVTRLADKNLAQSYEQDPETGSIDVATWVSAVQDEAMLAWEEALQTHTNEHPLYADWLTKRFKPMSLPDVQLTIPQGMTVLVPFCGMQEAGWFVFGRHQGVSFVPWTKTETPIGDRLQQLSDSFLGRGVFDNRPLSLDAGAGSLDLQREELWREMGTAMFRPTLPHLAPPADRGSDGVSALPEMLIRASDSMHDIGWHALRVERSDGSCRPLLNLACVSETPSLRTRRPPEPTSDEDGELPVVFSIVDPATKLQRLKGPYEERKALWQRRHPSSRYFEGKDASVTLLEGPHPLVARANVLHLACHGQLAQDSPLLASLALAPADEELAQQLEDCRQSMPVATTRSNNGTAQASDAAADDNGQYYVWKFGSLPLGKTGLVILSCCQLGRTGGGRRDVAYGLMRSLALAGAKAVLAHRWDANDRAAARLVAIFAEVWVQSRYHGRIAAALREAQSRFLADQPDEHMHEYYWAGWSAYDLS